MRTHAGRQIDVKRGRRRAARVQSSSRRGFHPKRAAVGRDPHPPAGRASYELLPVSHRAGIGAGRPAVLVGYLV